MVLASGCFDGLHAGHVRYLEAAKALCVDDELLICAVATDAYIQKTKHRQPRWTQADRLMTVQGLQAVDAAIPQFTSSIALEIKDYRPRLFVKGPDWKQRLPEDVYAACEAVGTSIAFVETPGRHVSETVANDEDALARFEALVLQQQPASEKWVPVTDYSLEGRRIAEGENPKRIIETFGALGVTSIFDAGCGPDGILVKLMREQTTAITIRGGDIQYPHGEDGFSYLNLLNRFYPWSDLVICREVLEHLTVRNIPVAVRNLCESTNQYVYLTTRFAKSPTHLLDVDTSDDLDPTHCSMLNQTFLRALFVLEGFKRRADLEAKLDWKKLGRVLVYERT